MYEGPVIDAWAPLLPVPTMIRHAAEHFPEKMLGYLRVFYKAEPTAEAVKLAMGGLEVPEADVVAALGAARIERTLVTGFDEKTHAGATFMTNEIVAELAWGSAHFELQGRGTGPIDAFVAALRQALGLDLRVGDFHEHALGAGLMYAIFDDPQILAFVVGLGAAVVVALITLLLNLQKWAS